jgi:hypothetical protein
VAGFYSAVDTSIPGFNIDLFVETTVPSLLGVLLGRTTVDREIDLGELFLSGDPVLSRTMNRWLKLSEYSELEGIEMLSEQRSGSVCKQRPLQSS